MNSSNPYIIDDLIVDDPFRPIFYKNRDSILFEHMSYKDYLNFLTIIGSRNTKFSPLSYSSIQVWTIN